MRPSGFDQSWASDWSRWVLVHGLPEVVGVALPVGHSIPVSVWIGPSTAAVMHLRRLWEDEDDPGTVSVVESDVDLFVRRDGAWIDAGGGGSGGNDLDVLARVAVPRRAVIDIEAETSSSSDGRGRCTAVSGLAGTDAVSVEVEQDGVVVRRPIEAPLGWFVISAEGDLFTVRVRDEDGFVLGEKVIDVPKQFS